MSGHMTNRDLYISLGILSFGSLALEIGLTRLLSVLYFPPFVYIVLSFAILGISLGAGIAALKPQWATGENVPMAMSLTGISSLSLIATAILTSAYNVSGLIIVLMLVPYTLIGFALTSIFNTLPQESRLLYAVDLIGAGMGAILIIPLMNFFGVINTLLLIGTIFGTGAFIFNMRLLPIATTIVGIGFYGSNLFFNWLSVDMANLHSEKPIQEVLLAGGEILETRWDAFARTDLVDPADGQPRRIYVDGGAASIIPPAGDNDFLLRDIGLFAFATAQPQRVFAIGTGGGLDAWFGLRVGAQEIVAVEVNPQSVQLVRDTGNYSGDLYDTPNIDVRVDEGRSVLERDDTNYDLIFLSQVVTLSAERIGYSLTENSVFTLEAFLQYHEHLTDDGYIAIKLYDELTLSRALSIVMAMFNDMGLSDAEALQHVVALLDRSSQPPTPLLLVRKTPFQEDELLSIGRFSEQLGFSPLYLPSLRASAPLDAIEAGTLTYRDAIAESNVDLTAPTDNRPFFYQFDRGIPEQLQPLAIVISVILLLLIVALIATRYYKPDAIDNTMMVYFAMLGMGFIMVEIVLIQQIRLFIGHPTLAITTVLAVVLIGAGLGSAVFQQIVNDVGALPWRIVVLIVTALFIWNIVWSPVSDNLISQPLYSRLVIVTVFVLPIAMLMGIPFAVGLEKVASRGHQQIAIAWMVNGIMTVVGSFLAVVISIRAGFTVVMYVSIFAYGIVLLVSWYKQNE